MSFKKLATAALLSGSLVGMGLSAQAAPIRTGIGARFGANLGYLKYTGEPTWNPF